MTSPYIGNASLRELMNKTANKIRCHQMFRMDGIIFNNLIHDLKTCNGLEDLGILVLQKYLKCFFTF